MSQKLALFLSALITVCVLGCVGIASLGYQAIAALNEPASAAVAPEAVVATPAPLASEASEASVVVEPTAAPSVEPTPEYKVSADQAAAVAMSVAPGTTLSSTPELVDFQGSVAYEVSLDAGKVYVDANSGQVLYNAVAVASAPQAGPVGQEQAVQIASTYMQNNGNTSEAVGLRRGRLRSFRGLQLFEVTFADETRVYINADTGEIVQVSKPEGDDD